MFDILDTVDDWLAQGHQVALATVVDTWGSAPRGVGAKMAVTAADPSSPAMVGSVSGGCVENAVIEEAINSLSDGKPRLLNFGVSDDTAWEVGLACGGKIAVYVEPLDNAWWQAVSDAVRHNQETTTVTVLTGDLAGQKLHILDTALDGNKQSLSGLTDTQIDALLDASTAQKRSQRVTIADVDVLIDQHRPRPRLVIVGGAHVAQSLAVYAAELDFRVALIDPRKVFATQARFPGLETVLHSYPDKALEQLGIDTETYITVLTHDPKIDDPALITALASKAPYIGVLSSSRTHRKRLARLTDAGIDPQLFDRIRIPIGLNIGAKTPEEIALCIMAEIVAVRNGALK